MKFGKNTISNACKYSFSEACKYPPKVEKADIIINCFIAGISFGSKPIFSTKGTLSKIAIVEKTAKIIAKQIVGKKYFFAPSFLPLKFDKRGETLARRPIPNMKIQDIMAFAILMAARVSVECFAATKTEPAPIKIMPKFPIIIGIARTSNSLLYFE